VRSAFAGTLLELAERDERVVLLTGDLGFTVWEPFAERYPDRFFNVGVAEQNMLGVATGLAESGYIPFAYSIATFASMRPYEFLRNGAVQHRLPVRLVGVGGGFDYGHNGVSHYALEDVGLMRLQPDMGVIAPADPLQTRTAVLATWDAPMPLYYRLGKQSQAITSLDGRFQLGRIQTIGDGTDVVFVTLGTVAVDALRAASLLAERGVAATVAVVASVSPPPVEDLAELLGRVPLAVAAEAHYVTGGVGSLVAEVIAERGLSSRLVRAGVRSMPRGDTGSQRYLYDRHGLSADRLADAALEALPIVQA
jgi:transketolase